MQDRKTASGTAMWLANNFGMVNSTVPKFLNAVDLAHRVLGPKPLQMVSGWLNKVTDHVVPAWNPYMPRGAAPLREPVKPTTPALDPRGQPRKVRCCRSAWGQLRRCCRCRCQAQIPQGAARRRGRRGLSRLPPPPRPGPPRLQVVYVPACVTRMMGPAQGDSQQEPVHEKLLSLFEKGGYEVVYPEGLANSCCGMMFNSRGFKDAAASKGAELEAALLKVGPVGRAAHGPPAGCARLLAPPARHHQIGVPGQAADVPSRPPAPSARRPATTARSPLCATPRRA
jgi:D-lactate dehydrogenase